MRHRRADILVGGAFLAGGAVLGFLALTLVRFDRSGRDRTVEGRTVIRFAAWGAKEETRELRERVVAPVNAAAGDYFVKLEPVPTDYPVKLATMIAGGYAPDIFYLDSTYLVHYAALGGLMDLTEPVGEDKSPVCDLADYYPSILRNYRWDGRLWALPWIAQPVVLYCNVGLFEKAGVELPDASWDWERFADAARRIGERASSESRRAWGFALQPGWPPLEMYVWQNEGQLLDDGGRVRITDERAAGAAQFMQDLIRTGAAAPLDVVLERGISNLFRDGCIAMFAGGSADDLDRTQGLRVVVRELPAGPGGRRATYAWHAGLSISAGTRHPERAFEAWKALLDAIQHWKIAPPRRSLTPLIEEIAPHKAPAADVIRRSMEYMRTVPVIREQKRWQSILGRRFKEPLVRCEADARTLAEGVEPLLKGLVE